MNASLSAALLLVLLAGGWLVGRRRPRPFLRSTDTSEVAALNRVQIERLQAPFPATPSGQEPAAQSPSAGTAVTPADGAAPAAEVAQPILPLQAGERRRSLQRLQVWMTAGQRDQRLRALAMAAQSNRRDVLPLLRRGLRDPDPAVMAAAAAAMERFRGRTTASGPLQVDARPQRERSQPGSAASPGPRSVLRTR